MAREYRAVPTPPAIRHARHLPSRAHIAAAALLALTPCACNRPGEPDRSADARASVASTIGDDTLAIVVGAPDSAARALVGREIDDVVRDSSLQASWALEPLERHVGIVHAIVGQAHLLLADSLVGYDGAKAIWRIRQAQRIAAPRPGEAWVTSCVIAGTETRDGSIVARVTLAPDDTLPTPHDAWRLDPVAWRFSPYPPATLSCFNEGGDR